MSEPLKPIASRDTTVRCVCGREMRALASQGPGHYRCANCRTRVHVDIPVLDPDPTRCGITIGSQRCTGTRVHDLDICDRHLNNLLVQAIAVPEIRERLGMRIGEEEIARHVEEAQRRREQEHRERRRQVDAMRPDCPVVYYVRLAEDIIKIGTTIYLPQRMDGLRIHSRDQVLAAEPGGQKLEKRRHHQFGHLRYHHLREDFRPEVDLLEHIAVIRAEHGPPYELAERMLTEARALAEARHHQ